MTAKETRNSEATCTCRYKESERSNELQNDLQKRLNRVIGQLNGVKRMIDENRYCGDVLVQLAAAEKAVQRVAMLVLQEHMKTCLVSDIQAGNDESIDEVIALMQRFA